MTGPVDAQQAAPPLRRNRDFVILWWADAVSEFGTSMSMLVLPLIGYAITGSPAEASVAAAGALLATLVFRLPAGALVDRWPRGRVLVCANLAAGVLYGSLAVAAAAHHLTLVHLVVAAAGGGVTEAFIAPAASAAIRAVVPPDQRPAAYSRLQIRTNAARLGGPPAGGALYSIARGLPFAVDAASYVAAAVGIRFVRTALPAPEPSGGSVVADLGEGLRFVVRHTSVRALMTWGALVNLGGAIAFVAVTLRLVRAGVHPAAIGLVDSASAVAGIGGALVAPRLIARMPTGRLSIATGAASAVSFALTALSDNPVFVGAFLGLSSLFVPASNAGVSAYVAHVVPDRLQGRVNAAAGFIAGGLVPFGPVLAGGLIAVAGGVAATVTGAGIEAASLLPLVLTASLRALGRPDTWPPPDAQPVAAGEPGPGRDASIS